MRAFFVAGLLLIAGVILVFSSNGNAPLEVAARLAAVARTPASLPPEEKNSEISKVVSEVNQIESCYQTGTCSYPQTDPKSYHFAVSHALANKIALFSKQFGQDPAAQNELRQVARKAVKIDDGFVQSAALSIFKDLPIDQENLQAIGEGMQTNSDPLVAEQALGELQRYMGTPQEAKMQEIVQGMVSGAHFASQKVGENILSFINDQNFPSYKQLQQQLPAQSRIARDLATALKEYRRQRSGG